MRAQHNNIRRIKHKMRCSSFQVCGDDRGSLLAVACRDDLVKEVGRLLVKREVAQFVDKCSAEHLSTNVKLSEMWS
jgi:hypothetical protein